MLYFHYTHKPHNPVQGKNNLWQGPYKHATQHLQNAKFINIKPSFTHRYQHPSKGYFNFADTLDEKDYSSDHIYTYIIQQ